MTNGRGWLEDERALQGEAAAVQDDLYLDQRLTLIGSPTVVGSAALGVMVRRDLDITVACGCLDAATATSIAELGAQLAVHPRVRQVQIRDDTGAWNADPTTYPNGLYLGLQYRSPAGLDWTLDLWFVDEPQRQPDLAHLRDLLPRLTDEHRSRIIQIKHARSSRPEHRATVISYDIYRAVLDGVETAEQFDEWRTRTTGP